MGKIIGGLIGFFILGPLGAIIGFFIGNGYDKRNATGFSGFGGQQHPDAQRLFFETLFRLLGCLAKADGQVSKSEINAAEELMRQSGLTAEHRQQAIELFNEGTQQGFDINQQMQSFLAVCSRNSRLKQTLLIYLITMAYADGNVDSAERAMLEQVASKLGIPAMVLNQLINMVGAQSHFRSGGHSSYQQGGARAPSQNELTLAYQALGVTAQDSDTVIKKAYRKLMSANHPDKLMGQGVPEDMIKMATDRSQEISKAYDLIKESRK